MTVDAVRVSSDVRIDHQEVVAYPDACSACGLSRSRHLPDAELARERPSIRHDRPEAGRGSDVTPGHRPQGPAGPAILRGRTTPANRGRARAGGQGAGTRS